MRDDLYLKEWQLALNETEDEEVIFGLFEHRLGGKYGCLDKNFWKFFMDFVKDKDEITYLNHYRMYTRLYIEDKQMVEKYRSEIERISKIPMAVAEFWIDTILYELDFGSKKSAIEVLKRVLNSAVPKHNYFIVENPTFSFHYFFGIIQNTNANVHSKKEDFLKVSKKLPISCYFPRNQIAALKKSQNFSIPRTFVYYITQSIKFNHQILQKLFNLCKYFFAVQPTPLCYRLVLGCRKSSKYRGQSLFLNNKDLDFKGLDNLYITNTFDVLSEIPTAYSQTIKRMYKCDSKNGIIDNQLFTIDGFKFVRDNFLFGMTALGSDVILPNGDIRHYGSDLELYYS
uniref:Uncharacterized protein n=1 Tax=Panagrolaimus davidi TaxID=227884 RepID=A0A914P3G3_9BILA